MITLSTDNCQVCFARILILAPTYHIYVTSSSLICGAGRSVYLINSAINIMNTVDDEDDRACASCGVVEEVDNTIKSEECYRDDEELNAEAVVAADIVCCASCGIDNVTLKFYDDGCDLVKYCSDKCREEHREQHKDVCKKRAAELHNKRLFTQPDGTHEGECPICFLPMPLEPMGESTFNSCCGQWICSGCICAHVMSNKHDKVKACSCPFGREPAAENKEENKKRELERAEANVPAALREMGADRYKDGNYDGALEYLSKAAELGDIEAHYNLSIMYEGEGAEKNEEKRVYHLETAAMGGHPSARYRLACIEEENGNTERAVKHHIIAANLGLEESMKKLWKHYSDGNITKEDLDATLRAHQAALDAMKSEQRDAAEVVFKN